MDRHERLKMVEQGLSVCHGQYLHHYCSQCPYPMDIPTCIYNLHRDARDVLTAQEQENTIPIDWLMRYAQSPTEHAITEWRKPKKEVLIKQIESLDKPMSFDDALRLVADNYSRVVVEETDDDTEEWE